MSYSSPTAVGEGAALNQKLQVLVTDDEPMLRSVIGDFIETLDTCRFLEAGDGVEALESLRRQPADVLLSDMRMPRMDLEELLGHIRTEFPDLIVIATSGYSDADNACFVLEKGAHEFLAKPLDLDMLERTLVWIPARARLLNFAADLFGGGSFEAIADWDGRFGALTRAMIGETGPFAPLMEHARRTAELAAIVMKERDARLARELQLAALLHEVGASSQHLTLIAERRPLKPSELQLVRTQPVVGARLVERRLPKSLAAGAIRRHLLWSEENAAEERTWDETRQLSCLLGVINAVDGIVHDRLDRAKKSPGAAQEMLKHFYAQTNLNAFKQVLSCWEEIERYYTSEI